MTAPATPTPPLATSAQDCVLLIGQVYLEAGLPIEAAFQAAIADYECGFICSPRLSP